MSELNDLRVSDSWGGGACPEQHTGTLTSGDRFYLRMRHGRAELHVASVVACELDGSEYPPIVNPEWDQEAFNAGEMPAVSFWGGRVVSEVVYDREPDDVYAGYYESQQDRDASFSRLLDQIWEGPTPKAFTTESEGFNDPR